MIDNKKRLAEVSTLISEKIGILNPSPEDIFLVNHLICSYYRKRIGISNSETNTMAAAFLWVYSKSNFLWEGSKKWSRQELANIFGANPQTTGNVASKIIKTLKIGFWDERFCRKDIMNDSPYEKFMVLESGMIVPKDILGFSQHLNAQNKTKEDYFDKAMDFLEENEKEKAIEYLNKALSFDDEYIEAINGLGSIYFYRDLEKSKEYYEKSVELSKKELGGRWPDELEWGIWENRPYLRALQGLGLIHWRNNEIEKAKEIFELLLKMNPHDNQGIRYCMAAIYKGLTWADFGKIEDKCSEKGNYDEQEELLKEQNEHYKFWTCPE
jgi:tetratricopeptide (TPR) repeat protein